MEMESPRPRPNMVVLLKVAGSDSGIYDENQETPTDTRNVLLIVAALIAAVTFQAGGESTRRRLAR
mgnify:CR=1 FL=1